MHKGDILEIEALREIYTRYQRQAETDEPDTERIVTEHVIRFLWHPHKAGAVMYSELNEANADDVIANELAFFKELGYEFEWKLFSYDMPADLGERLKKQGLSEDEKEAVMVLPLANTPDILKQAITFDIRKATNAEMFADVDQVYYEVWKDDPFSDAKPDDVSAWLLPRYEAAPDSLSLYVVYVDDKPVSYGRVEFETDNPFASIWGGSTLEAYRRRGIYTQMVAKRLQEALERGCQYLTVDARQDTSMPILEKLGFIRIAYATAYNWSPDAT